MKPPTIAGCLGVADTQATCDWYERLPGFQALPAGDDPGDDIRILMYEGGFAFMVYNEEQLRAWLPPLQATPVGCFGMFYLAVADQEQAIEAFRPHVEVVKDTKHDTEYGTERMFYFQDLNGYIIGLTPMQDR